MNIWFADTVRKITDFSGLLNTSIMASWMVLAVIGLRFLLKKAPKWTHVALWGLVAIRLLLPFSVESEFSLIPSTQTVPQEILRYEGTQLTEPARIDVISNPVFSDDLSIELKQTVDYVQIQMMYMTFVWIAGAAVLVLYMMISCLCLYCKVDTAVRFRDNIFQSDYVSSPFVLGIIRPRIYLPFRMDVQNREYVIAHEQAHIRRHDHWWKPFGFLLLTVHWFNPVMWLAYILLCRDIEMACDERVVKEYSEVQRADYSEALLKCSVKRSMISACPLAFGEVSVKTRIRSVLNYRKPAFWIVGLAVIACITAAVCFLTDPMSKTELSIDEHEWYFERAYMTDHEDNITLEEYQPGLQPKTENAIPMNAVLIADEEPMWYNLLTGDWDTKRTELHFIHERTESRAAHYTVELYRNAGELYAGADAVMEPMTDSDGYVLTVYYSMDGYDIQLIFTTEKIPGTVNGEKKLTLDDVIVLSEKRMELTWEDFAEYSYTDVGSGMFVCIYEIDETFYLEITGGSMHGTPMNIRLYANDGKNKEYVDIRRRYSGEYLVEEFLKIHKKSESLPLIQTVESETITAVLGSKEGQLIFDNTVVAGTIPEIICEYRYIPVSVSDTMRENLFEAYFGERADEVFCKDEQKDIWQLGETMSGDFYRYETVSHVSGANVFTISYRTPNLNPLDENRKDSGEPSGCSLTAEEAVSLCDDLLASMTDLTQYKIDYIHHYGNNGQNPFYWICYKRVVDGLTVNAYKDIYFFVDDNGVEQINGAFYETEIAVEYTAYLTAEEAVKSIKKQIDAVNWKEVGNSAVSRICLEYVTVRTSSGNITIVPIWRMELGNSEEERILNRNRILGIHAVTGELVQDWIGMGRY